MENYIEKIALLGAQIESLQAAMSKGLISDEIKKSISSLQPIFINAENIDISTFSEAGAILNEIYLQNKELILKATQAIAMIESSPYLLNVKEISKVLISLEFPPITKNPAFFNEIKGTSIPTKIPEYKVNPNIQFQHRPTVVEFRLEGNELVGRL